MALEYPMRLQSYLARSGFGSRRGCEDLITAGRVRVNGAVRAELGTKVGRDDTVQVDGVLAEPADRLYYYALHKPRGYVCSNSDPHASRFAIDLIDVPWNTLLFHVGRLDKDSMGLILYTNDGALAHAISHPSAQVEKEYLVRLEEPARESDLLKAQKGGFPPYRLKGAQILGRNTVRVVLTEGRNREIKNLFAMMGCAVKSLKRTRVGCVELGALPVGRYRALTRSEVVGLRKLGGLL